MAIWVCGKDSTPWMHSSVQLAKIVI